MDAKVSDVVITNYPTVLYLDSVKKAQKILEANSFVVVLKDSKYFGLLTHKDIALRKRVLSGDCVKERKFIRTDTDLLDGIETLFNNNIRALPCIDSLNSFRGVFTIENSLLFLCSNMESINPQKKGDSLHEISHFTNNPLQIIFSALNILNTTGQLSEQQQIVVREAEAAAQDLHRMISSVFLKYFSQL